MTQALNTKERHQSAINNARMVYVAIFIAFVAVCAIAVTAIMASEKQKTGFQAIKVKQPISYFDRTYMDESKAGDSQAAAAPEQTAGAPESPAAAE